MNCDRPPLHDVRLYEAAQSYLAILKGEHETLMLMNRVRYKDTTSTNVVQVWDGGEFIDYQFDGDAWQLADAVQEERE